MGSAIVLFLTAAVFAQTTATATITGTVVDIAGDAVANAPIQATNMATKTLYKAVSSDKGAYTIAQLPAGVYDLSVAVLGYNPYSQQNVAVAAGQTLRVDMHIIDFQLNTLGDGRDFRIAQLTPHPT